jgi:hypothetical protein
MVKNGKKIFMIFDIETLVDEELFRKAGRKNQIKRYDEEDEDYVPPAVYHLPICISYLITTDSDFTFKNGNRFVFHSFFSKDPSIIVAKFFSVFYKLIQICNNEGFLSYPILVSHNGKKFDLPILVIRAMKHYEILNEEAKKGLREFLDESDKWEKERANYRSRYSLYNLDTYYYFYSSLKSISLLWEIDSKTFMDGSGVKEFYEQGKFQEIALYCAEDVLTLGRVLNRLLIAKGNKEVALPESLEYCLWRVM